MAANRRINKNSITYIKNIRKKIDASQNRRYKKIYESNIYLRTNLILGISRILSVTGNL